MPVHPTYFQLPMSPIPQPTRQRAPPTPSRKPTLRLEFRDLSEEGAKIFLQNLDCANVLQEAVDSVISTLYNEASHIPPTRSVCLILRSMPGVAYTTGLDIDSDHKEIHFSTDYISGIAKERRKEEMTGVIVHEMVHCWQWAARGTCPGGLIEGIADFVRLRTGYAPPHWKRESGGDWDAGYQHTGYFLDWLERTMGDGTVIKINDRLKDREYDEDEFWQHCCGEEVKKLWKRYEQTIDQSSNDTANDGAGEGGAEQGASTNHKKSKSEVVQAKQDDLKKHRDGEGAPSYAEALARR